MGYQSPWIKALGGFGACVCLMDELLIGLVALLILFCVGCTWHELRNAQHIWEEDQELRKTRKLNGMKSCDDPTPIELIGSRPDSERPPGVDWTISNWSGVRGKYLPNDRGYAESSLAIRGTREQLEALEEKDLNDPTIPKELGS